MKLEGVSCFDRLSFATMSICLLPVDLVPPMYTSDSSIWLAVAHCKTFAGHLWLFCRVEDDASLTCKVSASRATITSIPSSCSFREARPFRQSQDVDRSRESPPVCDQVIVFDAKPAAPCSSSSRKTYAHYPQLVGCSGSLYTGIPVVVVSCV